MNSTRTSSSSRTSTTSKNLNLEDGQFDDLTPLSSLENLRVLNLTNCDEVTDCSALGSVVSLEELRLNSTGIETFGTCNSKQASVT